MRASAFGARPIGSSIPYGAQRVTRRASFVCGIQMLHWTIIPSSLRLVSARIGCGARHRNTLGGLDVPCSFSTTQWFYRNQFSSVQSLQYRASSHQRPRRRCSYSDGLLPGELVSKQLIVDRSCSDFSLSESGNEDELGDRTRSSDGLAPETGEVVAVGAGDAFEKAEHAQSANLAGQTRR